MKTITREQLSQKLQQEPPTNDDRSAGYALVNVLDHETFLDEHIPGSINIPKGQEKEFEQRFDKSKEIIVYCGSLQCPASTNVAEALAKRGFSNIVEYEGGMSDWKGGGSDVERGQGAAHEMRI